MQRTDVPARAAVIVVIVHVCDIGHNRGGLDGRARRLERNVLVIAGIRDRTDDFGVNAFRSTSTGTFSAVVFGSPDNVVRGRKRHRPAASVAVTAGTGRVVEVSFVLASIIKFRTADVDVVLGNDFIRRQTAFAARLDQNVAVTGDGRVINAQRHARMKINGHSITTGAAVVKCHRIESDSRR